MFYIPTKIETSLTIRVSSPDNWFRNKPVSGFWWFRWFLMVYLVSGLDVHAADSRGEHVCVEAGVGVRTQKGCFSQIVRPFQHSFQPDEGKYLLAWSNWWEPMAQKRGRDRVTKQEDKCRGRNNAESNRQTMATMLSVIIKATLYSETVRPFKVYQNSPIHDRLILYFLLYRRGNRI